MIRTVIIKTGGNAYAALSARLQPDMSQEQLIAAVRSAIEEFRRESPEKYADALVDGVFPWSRLYTHMDQGLLLKHGVDLTDYGESWLVVGNRIE